MKQFVLILSMTMGSAAFAGQIILDNQQSHYKLKSSAEITHTEYREEEQEDTCSREVQTGSHQECSEVPGEQICHTVGGGEECRTIPGERVCQTVGGGQECHEVGGGQECHMVGGGQTCGLTPSGYQCHDLPGHQECTQLPSHTECYLVPGHEECHYTPDRQECYQLPSHEECYQEPSHQECREVPEYGNEDYTCTKLVTVPYEVKDGEIINEVTVQVELNQKLPKDLNEVLDITQTPTTLAINSVQSTAKVLVFATQKQNVISDNGFSKIIETLVNIKMLERATTYGAFLAPTSIVKADAKGLMMTTGLVLDPKTIHFDLKLSSQKEVFINRSLVDGEVSFANSAIQTAEQIDFAKLGLTEKLTGKKVHLEIKVQSNIPTENLVNKQDIPAGIGQKKELDKDM